MKGLSKLATILLLSTGIAFSSGKVNAGDNVMGKSLKDMTPHEYSQWNWNRSIIDYNNTPEDERDESFKDYIVRGGSVVNQDGVKTKGDVEKKDEAVRQRTQQDYKTQNVQGERDIDFYAQSKGRKGDENVFKQGSKILFFVDFNDNSKKNDISRKFFIVDNNSENKEVIYKEENNSPIKSNFVYPGFKGISIKSGDYTAFFIGKDRLGNNVYNESYNFKVTE